MAELHFCLSVPDSSLPYPRGGKEVLRISPKLWVWGRSFLPYLVARRL